MRTKAAGMPVCSDRAVAIGTPPNSSPASTSVSDGRSGTRARAMSANNTGSASKRYLSKYSLAIWPERSVKVPVRRAIELTRWASSSGDMAAILLSPPLPHQDLLGDGGDMCSVSGEHMPDRQSTTATEAVTAEIVQVPFIHTHRAVEPDRVIEAGRIHSLVVETRRRPNGIRRQVVGEICQPTAVQQLVISQLGLDLHPCQRATCAGLGSGGRPIRWDEAAQRRRRPRLRLQRFGSRHVRVHRDGLQIHRRFRRLERRLEVENCADRLAGDHPPRRKAAPVADAVDLESNWLGVIAATDEIRAKRMDAELAIDGAGSRPQRLSHDLPAIQSTPRITGPNTDEGVGPVRLQVEKSTEIHRINSNY